MIDKLGKIALLLLLSATTAAGFLWLPPAMGFKNPALARIVVFHVPCAMSAYLTSFIATGYALRYFKTRDLADDIKSRSAFGLGLVYWVLTTVTGAIFAKAQWGAYWNWDIKQTAILMLTLIYVAYFALRAAIDDPRKQAAIAAAYAIFAVLAAPFLTYVLPNMTPLTLHPQNVLANKDALAPEYRIVLWSGVFGLFGLSLWIFRLQVALETLELRLTRRPRRAAAPAWKAVDA